MSISNKFDESFILITSFWKFVLVVTFTKNLSLLLSYQFTKKAGKTSLK